MNQLLKKPLFENQKNFKLGILQELPFKIQIFPYISFFYKFVWSCIATHLKSLIRSRIFIQGRYFQNVFHLDEKNS